MAYIFMEKMGKHYAMNFGYQMSYLTPKLDILTCIYTKLRLLKAHTKLLEAHTGQLEAHTRILEA